MTYTTINNGDTGLAVRTAINENFLRNSRGLSVRDRMGLPWMSRLARHNDELIRVMCVGDSFTSGVGGSIFQTKSWPNIIGRSLGSRSAGQGIILTGVATHWPTFTGTWWAGNGNGGPAREMIPNWSGTTDSTATATINGSDAWIILRYYTGAAAVVNWTVDGGNPGTTTVAVGQPWTRVNVPLPSSGDHTIVFTIPGSGKPIFGGIEVSTAPTGVQISNIGVGSSTTQWWQYLSSAYVGLFEPDLSIVFLGLNDWWQQLDFNTVTIPNITTICGVLAEYGTVALCTLPHAWNTDTKPITRDAYSDAIRAIAASSGYALIDFERYWGSWSENDALGLMNPSDTYHPSDYGYVTLAACVREMLFPDAFMLS